MTGTVGGMIAAVSAAAILSSIASALVKTKSLKDITRIAGSLIMILIILTPLTGRGRRFNFSLPEGIESDIKNAALDGSKKQAVITKTTAAAQISQYLEKKLEAKYGIRCKVELAAVLGEDGSFNLDSVKVTYAGAPTDDEIKKTGDLIESECGIPLNRQEHKGR